MKTLDDLERLARAATPGEWAISEPTMTYVSVRTRCGSQIFTSIIRSSQEQAITNATYIAACSPERVLALIECVRAADALEAEASKRLRFRDAERYPELCAALTQVRTALAALEGDK